MASIHELIRQSYPKSIERRMAEVMTENLVNDTPESRDSGNGCDYAALAMLRQHSPSSDGINEALARYLTIRDLPELEVTRFNVGDLAVELVNIARDYEGNPPLDKAGQDNLRAQTATAIKEEPELSQLTFPPVTSSNLAESRAILEQALEREKGNEVRRWADKDASQAIIIAGRTLGADLSSEEFAGKARMALAHYIADGRNLGENADKANPLATRLTSDIRHMQDMGKIIDNLGKHQKGEPVEAKWQEHVRLIAGRENLTKNIELDAAGHYHLLPRNEQKSVRWDLEYGNNLNSEDHRRIEAQAVRLDKSWNQRQPANRQSFLLQRAQQTNMGR